MSWRQVSRDADGICHANAVDVTDCFASLAIAQVVNIHIENQQNFDSDLYLNILKRHGAVSHTLPNRYSRLLSR